MKFRSSAALVVLAGLLVVLAAAPATAQSRIAILDTTGISVLDTTTGQLRARFELPLSPEEHLRNITASADGARLLVTSQAGAGGVLYVLDAVTGGVIARVPGRPSNGNPVVLPDGARAFTVSVDPEYWFRASTITTVDLSTFTTQVYSSPELSSCYYGYYLAMHPDGGTLYLLCAVRFWAGTGHLLSFHVTSTGLEPDPGFPPTGLDPAYLSVSPDGTRLFVSSGLPPGFGPPTLEVYDTAARTLLNSYDLSSRFPNPMRVGRVRAQSASRVFMRLRGSFEEVALVDGATGGILGEALIGGVLVGDQSGAMTFALEPNRLSRLDNDTAAPTTIATGSGEWLDATVLTDTCPLSVTTSTRLFTTAGGTGTLTIDAAPSCAWTVDASELPGLSFSNGPSGQGPSGQGSLTLDFSLAPAATPQRGALHVAGHPLTLEQTMPVTQIEVPAGGAVRQPFTLRGWAIDVSAAPPAVSPTVAAVHVWAWPADGGAPRFVGATGAARARPDIAAIYGSAYGASGFELSVRGLPSGRYTIVAYAQSARGGTFSGQGSVVVGIEPATLLAIDMPGAEVPRNFVVSGWAIDPSAVTGAGVDAVHVWAYPAAGGAPIWVGAAAYGGARADIAALFGAAFERSTYWLFAALPPGDYTLAVFARSTVTGAFTGAGAVLRVVVDSAPELTVDDPVSLGPGSPTPVASPFHIGGWGLDRGAAAGSGVDAFHVWAYPVAGGAPQFVGVAAPTLRPDVAGIFGPQFVGAGFLLTGATLPAGTYDLAVFAHSSVTQSFNNWRVVRITVQ